MNVSTDIKKMDKMLFQASGDDLKLNMLFDKVQEIIDIVEFLDRNQLQLFNQERMHRR